MTETENDVEVVHKCILSRKPRHLGIFFPPFLREPTTSTCALTVLELSLWHTPIASQCLYTKALEVNPITEISPR